MTRKFKALLAKFEPWRLVNKKKRGIILKARQAAKDAMWYDYLYEGHGVKKLHAKQSEYVVAGKKRVKHAKYSDKETICFSD